jgi:hypothetical protein
LCLFYKIPVCVLITIYFYEKQTHKQRVWETWLIENMETIDMYVDACECMYIDALEVSCLMLVMCLNDSVKLFNRASV